MGDNSLKKISVPLDSFSSNKQATLTATNNVCQNCKNIRTVRKDYQHLIPTLFSFQFLTIFAIFGLTSAGVIPAGFVAPYASSHNEHVVNHAIAAPVAAAAVVASPYVASPYVASPYVASPYVASPYVASPYVASPYVASPYAAYAGAYSAAPVLL